MHFGALLRTGRLEKNQSSSRISDKKSYQVHKLFTDVFSTSQSNNGSIRFLYCLQIIDTSLIVVIFHPGLMYLYAVKMLSSSIIV